MVVAWGSNLSIGMADALFANYQTIYSKWHHIYDRYIRGYCRRNVADFCIRKL